MTSKDTFRQDLQREFIRRCKKNPKYSLRAYAQFLEVDQSFLSKILNGHRPLTEKTKNKFATRLGLLADLKKKKIEQKNSFVDLQEDEYEMISSWIHFAILELMKTSAFSSDPAKIAKQLGCHLQEVKDAVARLERMGFITTNDRKWKLISKNHSWTRSDLTSEARRRTQNELVQKSLTAIENVPFQLRENGSLTIAIDSRRLPEFKNKITNCLKELSDLMQPTQKDLDSVYQVTIALFPLLQKNYNEENHV